MYRRGVGRLLVVDRDNRLRGIVTRSDLLKVHARLDAAWASAQAGNTRPASEVIAELRRKR